MQMNKFIFCNLYKIFLLLLFMEMNECINNNIDNYAFYLFLFLVTLSMGNDIYYVLQNIQNTDFIKKQINKYEDYSQLFSNVLCNNMKKIKNGLSEKNKKKKLKETEEIEDIKNNMEI